MTWTEVIISGMIVALLTFCAASIKKNGDIKQRLLTERTGQKVSWFEAVSYPDAYFTDMTLRK